MTRTPFICCNQVYFGNGAVSDLGTVVQRFGAGRVLVVTDRGVRNAGTLGEPLSALQRSGIGYAVFDDIKPEPNEETVDALVASDVMRRSMLLWGLVEAAYWTAPKWRRSYCLTVVD